jgi:hypothetical protein
MDKTVIYKLSADAYWNFGEHGIGINDARLSATVAITTTKQFDNHGWIHNLTVFDVHLTHPTRGRLDNSPSNILAQNSSIEALFLQNQCDGIERMIYADALDPTVLNFLQGLASIIPFTTPSQDDSEDFVVTRVLGWHGPHQSHQRVRRWHEGAEAISEIRSEIQVEGGDLMVRGGEIFRKVRNESSLQIAIFRGNVMVSFSAKRKYVLGSGTARREMNHKQMEAEQNFGLSASGESNLTLLSTSQLHVESNEFKRSVRSMLARATNVPFLSVFFPPPEIPPVCKGQAERHCFESLVAVCLSNRSASSASPGSSRGAIVDLVALLRASASGPRSLTAPDLSELPGAGLDGCGPRRRLVLHALAAVKTDEAQGVLAEYLSNASSWAEAEGAGSESEKCVLDALAEISAVREPTDELFGVVLGAAESFATGGPTGSIASMALLALAAIGRSAAAALKSTTVSVLSARMERAFRRDAGYESIHRSLMKTAAEAFESSPSHLQLALLGRTRQLSRGAVGELWSHMSEEERLQWRHEAVRWLAHQVLANLGSIDPSQGTDSKVA